MQVAILILIGLSAGMSSGLFGIGGGVLIVPALVYLLDFPMHRAIGTSLAVLLPPIGAAAVYAYYRAGHIDWQAALILAGTVFIGAWLGAMVATASTKTGCVTCSACSLSFWVFTRCSSPRRPESKDRMAAGENSGASGGLLDCGYDLRYLVRGQ